MDKVWSGVAERGWVEAQELLDRLFQPFEELLVGGVTAGAVVLDVGCGTGSTTLTMARNGRAVGIDISEPMIVAARARAEREGAPASFILANAQDYDFEPATFDLIISRFGVMFFDDPVRAFANLRRAAKHGAELRCIAWRSADENPFMTTAERAARPLLPNLPARRPNAPGQFAFADRLRVHSILEESGWTGIEIQPLDVVCSMPESRLVEYLTRLGPVGAALQEADEQTRAKVIETVRPAFSPFVHGTEVRFTAACWMVRARSVTA
jgi:SAM-dependent methyltransferase